MTLIPIDDSDIPASRALRVEFARFWSTERGEPRDIYDRFVGATPVAEGVSVQKVTDDPAPGVWVRPADAVSDRVLLYIHGGGYVQGSAEAYIGLVSQIATRARVNAFVLEYPLAPESHLPDAHDLAVATVKSLLGQYSAIAIAGDSAGGGLSLAATIQVHRQNAKVAAVVVFSPWTDLSLSGDSVRDLAVGDQLLDPAYLRDCSAAYRDLAAPDDPRASPLFGAVDTLPPLLIQTGTDEILLDDSRRLAERVTAAGGTVGLEVWQGMHHVFQLNVEQLVGARKALDSVADFLTTHLHS
ncbi:acetylesterase [Mycobacteroides stephanolepidis]|uniref:Acetylesterase n=1 Tax=[Mycobacterium] stephanolepidis TaxID=1520670 RepID=A0A1Z4F1U5_9MYCO|nr:alpha/beta hydrolase [[Mycobacterium] stephanolepidis]BAX99223.1 acetylesterase [[Mycobacterium] stephanolepidis]